ncbi:MAG: type II secretion system F family protein [Clostridiales bacterium]|nr:type II secretion system F family protein [Clostridiales bacterium]
MPIYQYNAVTLSGEKKRGTMDVDDVQRLTEKLREQNLYLVDYKINVDSKAKGKRLKPIELSDFCRQIGTMLSSGVVLIRAVKIIMDRDMDPKLKAVYSNLYQSLKQGLSLSEAMEEQRGVFPPMLINMYRAGEASGSIDVTSMKMAEHYEKEARLNSKIKSAMTYPIILLVITTIVIFVLFTFVLPTFAELFQDDMPPVTKFMFAVSDFMRSKWIVVVVVVAGLVVLFRALKTLPNVVIALDRFKLRIPKIGNLLKTIYTARFSRTLSSLYASGISLVEALTISKGTIGNEYISSQFDDLVKEVRNGMTVSEAISQVDGFDPKLASTILIGEETGRLDEMLESTADSFDYESEQATGRMTALIEPVMLVIMAGVVGFVMISVMLPISQMYGDIGDMGAGGF